MRNEQYMYIDLHGKSVKDTKELLKKKFAVIKENNITEFYIITGRGNHVGSSGVRGVLKKALPRLLKPYCADIVSIDAEAGSYKILLKKDTAALSQLLKAMNSFAVGSEDPKDHLTYFKKVAARAEAGNVLAMLLIANTYLTGEIKEFDDKEKALYFINRAKELGSIDAQTQLGVMRMEGRYVEKDYKEGLRLLKASTKQKDAIAAFWLGKYYALGQGVKQNDQQALFWMQQSADLDYPLAEFNLGYSYLMANFTPEDNDLAFKYFTKSADHGHIEAKTYLARCHACGYGTPINYEKAFNLYQQAAAFDETYAVYQTAQYYQLGRGTKKNDVEAFKFFLLGAMLKDGDCQAKVAEAYFGGMGVTPDDKAGFRWAKQAAEQKSPFGYYVLYSAYKNGLSVPANPAEAEKYLTKSAEAGWSNAQVELGIAMIKNPKKNLEEGIAWLKKAAEEEHPYAIGFLKRIDELIASRMVKPKSLATAPVSLVSAFPQTVYQENKRTGGETQKASASQAKKPSLGEETSPAYSGLRKGFLNSSA